MTMSNGKFGSMTSEINVTPMIDVLLVLLIIFMVIVPALPRGEAASVPKASSGKSQTPDSVVLEVLKGSGGDPSFRINQQVVARQDLPARLAAIYANRARRVLFVKGDDTLSFTQVAQAIDIGHAAGVDQIGLITPKGMAGN
ncbi:MAG: biopolymer transporter ExbD [Terracidiphilus sp.]|jgi:biopolymer transport protein ExbD